MSREQYGKKYGEQYGMKYGVADDEVNIERVRLAMLAEARDPTTFALLSGIGVTAGMSVLEVGAGNGSVTAWLAEQVGDGGRVVSTDVDLRFHAEMPANVMVLEHDIQSQAVPEGPFDLIHARAVLQHLPERADVLSRLVEATAVGGWLVIEDGAMREFAEQTLPEPYGSIHSMIAGASHEQWRDPDTGLRVLGWMRDLGLDNLDVSGEVWAMRPGEPGGEWWFLALERALPRLVDLGVVSSGDAATALEQVRAPGFVMISPTSIAAMGRKSG